MEENKNEEIPNEFKKIKQPKQTNTFIIKYIFFILLLIAITAMAIYFTMDYLTSQEIKQEEVSEEIIEKQEKIETPKNKAQDAIYGIKKYSETYDENDLKILNYVDVDGNVGLYEHTYEAPQGNVIKSYIQIQGLINKSIQNKVNERLKEIVYLEDFTSASETITANFSNILSVQIDGYDQNEKWIRKGINIDLTTGADIPLEKVFVSSAPINSYLTEGLYKVLAWDSKTKNTNEENWEFDFNMDKIDMSEFEDKSILLINKYNKYKDNVDYTISPSGVSLYNLLDKNLVSEEYIFGSIDIEFISKIEEVAIYRRYLTDMNIFEESNIGFKNLIVCTNPTTGYESILRNSFKILNYGKISNNIFMEDIIENINEDDVDEGYKKIIDYFQNTSNKTKESLKVEDNQGLFYQRKLSIYRDMNESFYTAMVEEIKATCNEEYFQNMAFKDYIENKNQPSVGPTYYIFGAYDYEQEKYPNLKITGNLIKDEQGYDTLPSLYFSLDGEYLGTTEEEAKAKIQPVQEEI